MTKSSIMIDLDDERSEKITEILSNKTARKILQSLAEGEKCGSDLAGELKIPLNTVSYNLKKLIEAGLIEKSKKFFWSMKGKKMDYYRVSNKKIVIMPKRMVRGVLPAVIVAGAVALGIRAWTRIQIQSGKLVNTFVEDEAASFGESAARATGGWDAAAVPQALMDGSKGIEGLCANDVILGIAQSAWLWFLVGALTALLVYLVWNLWRKR
ncbi:MAG: ArsR family transcriptional regulator [archaeon]